MKRLKQRSREHVTRAHGRGGREQYGDGLGKSLILRLRKQGEQLLELVEDEEGGPGLAFWGLEGGGFYLLLYGTP